MVGAQTHRYLSRFLSGHTQLPAPGEEGDSAAFQHLQGHQGEGRARLSQGGRTGGNGQKVNEDVQGEAFPP